MEVTHSPTYHPPPLYIYNTDTAALSTFKVADRAVVHCVVSDRPPGARAGGPHIGACLLPACVCALTSQSVSFSLSHTHTPVRPVSNAIKIAGIDGLDDSGPPQYPEVDDDPATRRGFDRLRTHGFTISEVAALRSYFTPQVGGWVGKRKFKGEVLCLGCDRHIRTGVVALIDDRSHPQPHTTGANLRCPAAATGGGGVGGGAAVSDGGGVGGKAGRGVGVRCVRAWLCMLDGRTVHVRACFVAAC